MVWRQIEGGGLLALIAVENRGKGGGGGGDYAEIEPWAPALNHFYWSTLTIGGGLEQRRLGIGCRSMLRGRQGVGGEE